MTHTEDPYLLDTEALRTLALRQSGDEEREEREERENVVCR